MARSKKNRVLATLKPPVTVRVLMPEFELLDAIRHLDVKALANVAKAEIGLGYVGCCCGCGHQLLRAVIRKGIVTGLRVDEPPKKDRTPVSPEFVQIFRKAHSAALKRVGPLPNFPMPVVEFFNRGAVYDIQVLTCIRMCIWDVCVTCCWRTDEPGQEPICGHVTIDTTVSD